MNTREIIDRLRARHPAPRWAFFEELRCSTGFGSYAGKDDVEQRIDAWAMDTWERREAFAFEVKVSRADWLRELKQPEKRTAGMRRSERFYFVAPHGLIKQEEIPPGCGLIDVKADRLITTVRAPKRPPVEFERGFIAMILRRQYRRDEDEIGGRVRDQVDDVLAVYHCVGRDAEGKPCPDQGTNAVMWCAVCAAKARKEKR